MANPFRGMDLYKGIIFACLLLMPVVGGWAYWLHERIGVAKSAVAAADRNSRTLSGAGELQKIGWLQQSIANMTRNAVNAEVEQDVGILIDRRMGQTFKGEGLRRNDYTVRTLTATTKPGEWTDTPVSIEFKRDGKEAFPLTREQINAFVFNMESGGGTGVSPWKLRSLKLRNADTKDKQSGGKKPPPEISEQWFIDKMVFVKREPDTQSRRAPRRR
jgi:hypothetical protein